MGQGLRPVVFDYVEQVQLEEMQKSFAKAAGIACSIFECATNKQGTLNRKRFQRITSESGCSRFCKLVRSTARGLNRCKACDFRWAQWMYRKAHRDPEVLFRRYRCHSGLIDMVAPIFIGRDIRGFVFGGQRRRDEEVIEKRLEAMTRLARDIGVNGNELIAAYLKLPAMTDAELDSAASFMAQVANQVSDLALQARRFHLVSKSAAAVADCTEPAEVYRRILASAMGVAGCERATLWEYEPTKRTLHLLGREVPPSISDTRTRGLATMRRLGEGLAGRVARTGKAEAIENIDKEKKRFPELQKFLGGMKSEYAVPVKNRGTLISVLTVKDVRVGKWPKAVTEGLQLLADVAAIAILNARAMQSKQTLLETASHELLGPFHGIRMLAEELVQRPETLTHQELRTYGRMALSRLNLAEAHVRNMLLIAREDRTGLPLHESRARVGQLIERALQLVRDFAQEKHVDLTMECPRSMPRVRVDPRWIADVALRNLLHNAVKYAPENTNVTISAGLEEGGMNISVEDKGPGMGPDEIKHLGERFFRRDALGGLGLGLAAVKAIMRVHGGSATFRSRPGRYFRATIHLPVERMNGEAKRKHGTSSKDPHRRRR